MSTVPEANRTLAHYEIVEKLGEGGMGVVWKARDTTLNREVAIKVLPEAVAGDAERLARFENEARALAALNHPGIATIHGLEHADGVRFLVMELAEGEDLAARLARGPMPVETALAVAVQIAEALETAHEQGIIHRDLKPANVKITDDDKVKILDFGLAKMFSSPLTSDSGSPSLSPTLTSAGTAQGVILGTAAYMSPEQAKGKTVDRRADVWAFGVVLHEMLTGRSLFKGDSVSETLAAVLMREPDAADLPANTPLRVRRLLERCLRKDAQSRLRDVGDARLVIEEALAGQEWTRVAADEATAVAGIKGWVAAALVVAALAAGAVAGRLLAPAPAASGGSLKRLSIVTAQPNPIPRISPDGTLLVYGGEDGLIARRLDGYEETPLPGTHGNLRPAFSSDGRWISFVRQQELFKMPADGSAPPIKLGEFPRGGINAPVWLSDDTIVAISREPFTLMKIPAAGGDAETVPIRGNGVGQNVFWSVNPIGDGRHLLAAADTFSDEVWRINVVLVDAETGDARILVEDAQQATLARTGHLVFSRREALLAVPFDAKTLEVEGGAVALFDGLWIARSITSGWFSLADDGTLVYRTGTPDFTRRLATVDADGNVAVWSDERREFARSIRVSPDGGLLAVQVLNTDQGLEEIWTSAMDRPRLTPFVDEPGIDCGTPVFSRDASMLYYTCSGKGDVGGLYRRRTDGTGEAELLIARESEDSGFQAFGLTPDDAWLLFRRTGQQPAVMLLPTEADSAGKREPKLLHDGWIGSYVYGPTLSPDGKLLAYQGGGTGRAEVYLQPLGADGTLGQRVVVTSEGGSAPRWGKTGPGRPLELFYRHDGKIWRVEVVPATPIEISEPRFVFDETKLRSRLAEPLPGGRFLFAQSDEAELDEAVRISVVLNWHEELRRMVE